MGLSVSIIIIIITCVVSFIGFSNNNLVDKLIFYPPAISQQKQWYRFFTCGFIHKDIAHLAFNMYALYIFGNGREEQGVEPMFTAIFYEKGKWLYLLMYLLALGACLLPTYKKNKNNYNYRSLGASGAVSAVVFAYILLDPMRGVGLVFIPVFIPGFLFGGLYLFISYLLDKRGGGGINHSAHIWGALFGIGFLIVCCYSFSAYPVVQKFIDLVRSFDIRHMFSGY
jgi:membrane associated rhomboid family serine protease